MPLSNETLLTLAGYIPRRNGYDVPGTNAGAVFMCACWNWTLSGGRLTVNDPLSAPSIVEDLMILNYDDPHEIFANGINVNPHARYNTSNVDLGIMQAQLPLARTARANRNAPFTGPQTAFATALVRIILRVNHLTPGIAAGSPYVVVMKSSEWWNTDHWAIGIRLPPNNRIIYVQTIPDTPVFHNCNVVWDEHYPDVTVGIADLLPIHINFLNGIPRAPCRTCNISHGARPSVFNSWHQCTLCGAIYCPNHSGVLVGKLGRFDQTRTCGVAGCGGRTRLW